MGVVFFFSHFIMAFKNEIVGLKYTLLKRCVNMNPCSVRVRVFNATFNNTSVRGGQFYWCRN